MEEDVDNYDNDESLDDSVDREMKLLKKKAAANKKNSDDKQDA